MAEMSGSQLLLIESATVYLCSKSMCIVQMLCIPLELFTCTLFLYPNQGSTHTVNVELDWS